MNKRKRIAMIIPGGIGTGRNNIGVPVMERLVKLLARDFQITVFSLFKINKGYRAEGFELVDVSASNSLMTAFKLLNSVRDFHRLDKFDVIHGFWAMPSGFLAVVLGRLLTIKSVVSILGGDAISLKEIGYGQLRRWLPRQLILWTLKKSDDVILLTHYLLENLRKAGLKRSDVKIIPWGIDTSIFYYLEKPQSKPLAFLHIANLHPVKDQETLLRAFKIINDNVQSRLTIIGEGVLEREVKSLAEKLGLMSAITFQAPLPYEMLPPYYHNADILLHTSLSEGQSEVVTEAMSCGVVVCGTRVGILYDLPDCCISVAVRDYQALGSETLRLIDDHAKFNELRKNAYNWASSHSILWTIAQVKDCYNNG